MAYLTSHPNDFFREIIGVFDRAISQSLLWLKRKLDSSLGNPKKLAIKVPYRTIIWACG
ncbi:hypothetical protein VPHD518_0060 [Vibrio phage D518]